MLSRSTMPALRLSAVLLLAGGHAALGAEQVTFRFNPPAGTTWREASKVSTAIPVPHRDMTRKNETDVVSRVQVRRAGQRLQLSSSIVSATNKLDGTLMESPLLQTLPGLQLTYALGADGQIVDMVDFPGLLAQVKKGMPAERFEQVSPFFTAESLLGRRRAAANPLVSGLAGKTVALGGTSTFPGTVVLPAGDTFPVQITATVKGREATPACGGCVRVDFTTAPVLQTGKAADLGATGSGSALIDPDTLLTWSLKHDEVIVMEEPGARNNRMKVDLKVESSLAPEK